MKLFRHPATMQMVQAKSGNGDSEYQVFSPGETHLKVGFVILGGVEVVYPPVSCVRS